MLMVAYIILGIVAGIFGGFFGIGGGLIIVPALVYFFKFNQHQAQGTSLAALLLPIGLWAFFKYYKAGNANLTAGLLIAIGFFVGGFLGANFAHTVPDAVLKKIFGVFLIIVAATMFVGK